MASNRQAMRKHIDFVLRQGGVKYKRGGGIERWKKGAIGGG